jgi:hypothetical protein
VIEVDADVELTFAEGEPAAAAGVQRGGLGELPEAEEVAKKVAGGRLAAGGRGDLDVIEHRAGHAAKLLLKPEIGERGRAQGTLAGRQLIFRPLHILRSIFPSAAPLPSRPT